MSKLLIAVGLIVASLVLPWTVGVGPTVLAESLGAGLEEAQPLTCLAVPAAASPTSPRITGSASFVSNIRAGLELMRTQAPADYQTVVTYVTEIKEGASNYAWGGRTDVQISTNSAAYSATYAGAIVLHQATHVKNWATNNQPVFGCDGEAKSLRTQADYLYRVGDNAMGQWVEGQIGTWC